jgi:hypothetical protein
MDTENYGLNQALCGLYDKHILYVILKKENSVVTATEFSLGTWN